MNQPKIFIGAICAVTLMVAASPSAVYSATPTSPLIVATAGANPTIAVEHHSGTRYAAWVRSGKPRAEVVIARSVNGQNFSEPIVVSGNDTGIVSATVSPAQVAVGPKDDVYVLYERQVPYQYLEQGRRIPRLAHSSDGGKTFATAANVTEADGIETSAQMTDLAVTHDGTVVVAWLDYREVIARKKLPEDQQPEDKRWLDSDDPTIQVRLARSSDGGKTFDASVLIVDGASERSRVALASSSDGTLYAAWRSKLNQFKGSYDAVRDVMIASSNDLGRSWSAPVKVHDDRFKAGDCPEITLGLATDNKNRLHVAWYTGTGIKPGIYYAVSENHGRSFTEPVTLLTADWVPYANVKLAVDANDNAWVAFEDRRDENGERVVLNRIDFQGAPSTPWSWSGRSPDLAARRNSITLLWNDETGAVRMVQK